MSSIELDISAMRAAAGDASSMLRSLAHEDRLLLLCQLSQGERCVSELQTLLDMGQPMLSQQLGTLRRDGLVATRRSGRFIYYRIADARLLEVLETLYRLYCPEPSGNLEHGDTQHNLRMIP